MIDLERARELRGRMIELHVTPEYVRAMTTGEDNLKEPLQPTRDCLYSDDARAELVRELFCSTEFHARVVRGLLLFSDYLGSDPDAVMGAGETTAVLYSAAARGRVGYVLDLGCGAGTLALLLAPGIGTDINPRAIAYAELNAAVNKIASVEFRVGDMYEPVGGQRFDLIVSQPPYYPGKGLTFLHGGERGDELPWRVVRGVRQHLAPGGRALVFTSWPQDRGELRLEGLDVLELRTNRRERHGTRQSIAVLEHGTGAYNVIDVPPEAWGAVTAARIDELLEGVRLAGASEDEVLAAQLESPDGVRIGEDGVVRGPLASLVDFTVVETPLDTRAALRRGLLRVRRSA